MFFVYCIFMLFTYILRYQQISNIMVMGVFIKYVLQTRLSYFCLLLSAWYTLRSLLTIVCHNWWARFYSKICDFMLCIRWCVLFPFRWFPFLSCVLVLNRKRHVYDLTALDYHYSSWQVVISLKVENFLYLPQWLWSRSLYLEKL